MVRTKTDRAPIKTAGAKAPHKIASSGSSKRTVINDRGRSSSGGNPYHPRDTPDWQKPITCFLNRSTPQNTDNAEPNASTDNAKASASTDNAKPSASTDNAEPSASTSILNETDDNSNNDFEKDTDDEAD